MNDKEDIKKQLKIKNKEIYLNKLNLDLDNNLEVLVLTIDNLLNTQKESLKKRITEIEENNNSQEEYIDTFFEAYRLNIMNLLDIKKTNLRNTIIVHDDLEVCKNNIKDNYYDLKTKIEEFSCEEINNLIDNLITNIDNNFTKRRIKEYLKTIYIVNLNNKVLDVMKNRDIILLNTFKETYLKYLELNKNTIGV